MPNNEALMTKEFRSSNDEFLYGIRLSSLVIHSSFVLSHSSFIMLSEPPRQGSFPNGLIDELLLLLLALLI